MKTFNLICVGAKSPTPTASPHSSMWFDLFCFPYPSSLLWDSHWVPDALLSSWPRLPADKGGGGRISLGKLLPGAIRAKTRHPVNSTLISVNKTQAFWPCGISEGQEKEKSKRASCIGLKTLSGREPRLWVSSRK